jgi:hypothetical protein
MRYFHTIFEAEKTEISSMNVATTQGDLLVEDLAAAGSLNALSGFHAG